MKQIKSIFALGDTHPPIIAGRFKTKKIVQNTKILDGKTVRQGTHQAVDSSRSRPGNNNVIHIDQHINLNATMREDEQGGVGLGSSKTKLYQTLTETGIPSTGRLL
jgi:hypothetical protein